MSPPPTVERAYQLARSGKYANLAEIKARLKAEGCHAIEPQLTGRSIQGHLRAICAATYKAPGGVGEAKAASEANESSEDGGTES